MWAIKKPESTLQEHPKYHSKHLCDHTATPWQPPTVPWYYLGQRHSRFSSEITKTFWSLTSKRHHTQTFGTDYILDISQQADINACFGTIWPVSRQGVSHAKVWVHGLALSSLYKHTSKKTTKKTQCWKTHDPYLGCFQCGCCYVQLFSITSHKASPPVRVLAFYKQPSFVCVVFSQLLILCKLVLSVKTKLSGL